MMYGTLSLAHLIELLDALCLPETTAERFVPSRGWDDPASLVRERRKEIFHELFSYHNVEQSAQPFLQAFANQPPSVRRNEPETDSEMLGRMIQLARVWLPRLRAKLAETSEDKFLRDLSESDPFAKNTNFTRDSHAELKPVDEPTYSLDSRGYVQPD
jgi:hypothetical protein